VSGSASISLERGILGHTLGFAPMTAPARVYVALCQIMPAPTETGGGAELSGGGYARVPATFALMASPANAAANVGVVEFAPATSSWGTVGYFELWSAQTGGERLYWGPLVDPSDPATPLTLDMASGDILRFSVGDLAIQVAEVAAPLGGVGFGANVKNYGAVGDGVANDTAAINAAITAASATLHTTYWNPQYTAAVVFPPGCYMTDGIDLPCGISLTGAGQLQTTIALRANANRSVVRVLEDPSSNPLPWLNRNHGRLSGFCIDGNSNNQAGTSHGIEVVASSYPLATRYGSAVDIDDINTVGTLSSGIYIGTNRNYGMITNVRIAYAGGTGLQFFSCYDWYCTNIGIGNCQQEGVKAYLCAGLQFTNLAIWSCQNAGLVLNSCGGFMVFENVQLDYNSQYGLYHNPAGAVNSHLSISNLQLKDNGVAANNTYSAIYISGIGGAGSSVLLANLWFNWTANSPNRSKYLIETDTSGYVNVSNISYSTTAGATAGSAPYATAAFNQPARIIGATPGATNFNSSLSVIGALTSTLLPNMGASATTGAGYVNLGSHAGYLASNVIFSGGWKYIGADYGWYLAGHPSAGGAVLWTGATGTAGGTYVPVEAIWARADGSVRFAQPVGFNNTNPVGKPTVSGSRAGNAALASLLTALAATGLITDSSTA